MIFDKCFMASQNMKNASDFYFGVSLDVQSYCRPTIILLQENAHICSVKCTKCT